VYPGLPKISVDYAIMEPVSQGKGKAEVVVVEMDVQWLDVGSCRRWPRRWIWTITTTPRTARRACFWIRTQHCGVAIAGAPHFNDRGK